MKVLKQSLKPQSINAHIEAYDLNPHALHEAMLFGQYLGVYRAYNGYWVFCTEKCRGEDFTEWTTFTTNKDRRLEIARFCKDSEEAVRSVDEIRRWIRIEREAERNMRRSLWAV